MTWNIIDKKNNKEAVLNDNKIITIGNTEECDIIVCKSSIPKILSQLFL